MLELTEKNAKNFDNKTAIITGGAGGLGAGIAKILAEQGANISLIDIDSERDTAQQYNVRSVPTVVIEENGSEVNRLIGATTKQIVLENLS